MLIPGQNRPLKFVAGQTLTRRDLRSWSQKFSDLKKIMQLAPVLSKSNRSKFAAKIVARLSQYMSIGDASRQIEIMLRNSARTPCTRDAGRSKHHTVFGEVLRNKSSGIALSQRACSEEEHSGRCSRRRLRHSPKCRASRVRAVTSSGGGSVQLLDALGVADHQIKSGVGTTPHACVKLRPAA